MTVATLWQQETELEDVSRLEKNCERVIALPLTRLRSYSNSARALFSPAPIQAAFCWSPQLMSAVKNLLTEEGGFDAVHVEHLRGAQYGLEASDFLKTAPRRIPVVWDSVDCISYLFEQAAKTSRSLKGKLVSLLDLERTRRFEGQLISRFDHVLVTSKIDRDALQVLNQAAQKRAPRLGGPAPIAVIPNGVDTDYFTPGGMKRNTEQLVFSGKMSYHANITAVLHLVNEIMPLIWTQRPAVTLRIVGKDPAKNITDLEKQFPGRIKVTGTVADIRPFLQEAAVSVVPILYGAGVQNKVLEAMACGTPVVATPIAAAALDTEDGKNIHIAANPATFARKVLTLFDSELQRSEMGKAGYDYVIAHHRWENLIAQLEKIYSGSPRS